jgi:hypothetical protein
MQVWKRDVSIVEDNWWFFWFSFRFSRMYQGLLNYWYKFIDGIIGGLNVKDTFSTLELVLYHCTPPKYKQGQTVIS